VFFKDHRNLYREEALEGIPWLEYGFGTNDSPAWPDSWELATLRQVHSAECVIVDGHAATGATGDALITDTPGVLVGVRTADCLPILLVATGRRVVAAVHAGWRGTVAGVAFEAASRMVTEFDADPARIRAAIGPAIGKCCFEVGPEVAIHFRALFPERDDLNGRAWIDLAEANRRQLTLAGIPINQVYSGAPCNCCHPEEFYSYRRDREAEGRMLSVAGIRA